MGRRADLVHDPRCRLLRASIGTGISALVLAAYGLVVVSTGPDPDVAMWVKFYGGAVATAASVSVVCTLALESWNSKFLILVAGLALGVTFWSALLIADDNLWQSGSNGAAFRILVGAAIGAVSAISSWIAFLIAHRSESGPARCSKPRGMKP